MRAVPYPNSRMGRRMAEHPSAVIKRPDPPTVCQSQQLAPSSSRFDDEFGAGLSEADLQHIFALTDSFSNASAPASPSPVVHTVNTVAAPMISTHVPSTMLSPTEIIGPSLATAPSHPDVPIPHAKSSLLRLLRSPPRQYAPPPPTRRSSTFPASSHRASAPPQPLTHQTSATTSSSLFRRPLANPQVDATATAIPSDSDVPDNSLLEVQRRLIESSQERARLRLEKRNLQRQLMERDGTISLLRARVQTSEKQADAVRRETQGKYNEFIDANRLQKEQLQKEVEAATAERIAQEQELVELAHKNKALHKELASERQLRMKLERLSASASLSADSLMPSLRQEQLAATTSLNDRIDLQSGTPLENSGGCRSLSQSCNDAFKSSNPQVTRTIETTIERGCDADLVTTLLSNACEGGLFELVRSLRDPTASSINADFDVHSIGSQLETPKRARVTYEKRDDIDVKCSIAHFTESFAQSVEASLSLILNKSLPAPCLLPILQRVIESSASDKLIDAALNILSMLLSKSVACLHALLGSIDQFRLEKVRAVYDQLPVGYCRSPVAINCSSFVLPAECGEAASLIQIRRGINYIGDEFKLDASLECTSMIGALINLIVGDRIVSPPIARSVLDILLQLTASGHPRLFDQLEPLEKSNNIARLLSPALADIKCRTLATRLVYFLCSDQRYLKILTQTYQGSSTLDWMYMCFTTPLGGDIVDALQLKLATVEAFSYVIAIFGGAGARLLIKKQIADDRDSFPTQSSPQVEARVLPRLALMIASELDSGKAFDTSPCRLQLVEDAFLLMEQLLPYTDLPFQIDGTRHTFLSLTTRIAASAHFPAHLIERANSMRNMLDRFFERDGGIVIT